MNELFSFPRFWRLFVKHTMEHYRTYVMAVAVLTGALLLGGAFLFYMMPDPPDVGLQSIMFANLLIIAGTIFASTTFNDYGQDGTAIPALTLPATPLEKFLVGWIWSYPIYIFVYLNVFYVSLYGLGSGRHWASWQHFQVLDLDKYHLEVITVLFSVLHAIALLGSIYFNGLAFIKTAFGFFVGLAILIVFNLVLLKLMTGLHAIRTGVPFGTLDFSLKGRTYAVFLQGWNHSGILAIMMAITVLLWTTAFFKLKEKQV